MTTPAKKYQNVSYKELIDYAEQNPHRGRTLAPIEIPPAVQETSLASLGLSGYTSCQLDPASILGVLSCLQNPAEYSIAPKNVRIQQVIDLSTQLQQQSEELRNSHLSRKRKKFHDLVAVAYNGGALEIPDYGILYQCIAHLQQMHFIMMHELKKDHNEKGEAEETGTKGVITFSSDPSTWSRERSVWIVDLEGRWVALPSEGEAQPLTQFLEQWAEEMEQKQWMIMWPDIDLKKTELIEQLITYPSWKETDRKLTKEHLATRLSRVKTLRALSQLA
jgi:hypothetical protein